MRIASSIVLLLGISSFTLAADEAQEKLDKAKVEYATSVEKATQSLLSKFDDRIKTSADLGNLDAVLQLREEKKGFDEEERVPKSPLMKSHYGDYQTSVKAARKKLSDAYEVAVKDFTKKLDTDRAEEIRKEYQSFKAGPVRPAAPPPAVGPAVPMQKAGPEVHVQLSEKVKMTFCWIPEGKANLGPPATERMRQPNESEHAFATKGFWLGKFEVTQAEWAALASTNPSTFNAQDPATRGFDTSRYPVESITWDDCQGYLAKLRMLPDSNKAFGKAGRFAFPSEDEWEYACRGGKGNGKPFHFGDELNGSQANMNGKAPYGAFEKGPFLGRTTKVGTYEKEFPHPWGLCDMHGNVWEFCETSATSPKDTHVIRGGCYGDDGRLCRAASRNFFAATNKYNNVGFRVCFRPN